MRIVKTEPETEAPKETPKSPTSTKPLLSSLTLPTTKSVPLKSIGEMTCLIYGEKKIGKTSLASQFPKAVFLMCEPGGKGLDIYQVPINRWLEFVKYIDLICEGGHDFENVVIDTVDALYNLCFEYVCKEEGIEDPGDLGYGKGWNIVKRTFQAPLIKLVNSGYGALFLSHATEKDYIDRTGVNYTKIIPSMPKQAKEFVSGICDAIIFYGYHGEQRLLTVRGSDTVESGIRPTRNFWIKGGYEKAQSLLAEKMAMEDRLVQKGTIIEDGEEIPVYEQSDRANQIDAILDKLRVHSIPAGNSEVEAYFNFVEAFNNRQITNGAPDRDWANIEKAAPMKKKDKDSK